MQSRHWCQLEPLTGAVELLPAGGGTGAPKAQSSGRCFVKLFMWGYWHWNRSPLAWGALLD